MGDFLDDTEAEDEGGNLVIKEQNLDLLCFASKVILSVDKHGHPEMLSEVASAINRPFSIAFVEEEGAGRNFEENLQVWCGLMDRFR